MCCAGDFGEIQYGDHPGFCVTNRRDRIHQPGGSRRIATAGNTGLNRVVTVYGHFQARAAADEHLVAPLAFRRVGPVGGAVVVNAGDVLGGYATQDNRSSAFFRDFDGSVGGSMQELLDSTILNFEQRFKLTKVEEAKTGQVKGPGEKKWPAIFTTFDATVVKGRESFEMRFYLLVFDTGNRLYTLQASTTRPVREARERQIYEMIRSIVAKS